MRITPLGDTLGAQIDNIDLSQLSEAEFAALYQAFLRYKVLFFREQLLSTDDHVALAKRFGELEPPHPFRAQDYPPIRRAMVQTHPETGQDVLFINEQFTRAIADWPVAASQQRLATLFSQARQSKYHVRFRWQKHSVAIWDNRATQHYAVTD